MAGAALGHYLTVINVGLQNAQRFREKRPEAAWAEVEEARDQGGAFGGKTLGAGAQAAGPRREGLS